MSGQEVSSSVVAESHPPITFYPKRKPWVVFFQLLIALPCHAYWAICSCLLIFALYASKCWSVRLVNRNFEHKYDSLKRNVTRPESDKLVLEVTLEIPSRFIPIAEKESFNDFLDALYEQLEFSLYGETNAP